MSELDGLHDRDDGLNNPEVRADFRSKKEDWETNGCLPNDEASAFVRSLAADVEAGKIPEDDLRKIVANARKALAETKDGSTRELYQQILKAAGASETEVGQ